MKWLGRLFRRPTEPPESVQDPVLGRIVWEPVAAEWISLPQGARTFTISFVGKAGPDAPLLPFARKLHSDALAFMQTIALALEREATRTPELAGIIRSLQVDSVELSCPERPRDGMVYFHGAEHDPAWRFDLIDGQPVNLGCDT